MTMSAVDFLNQWFETDVLKATMAASELSAPLWVRSPEQRTYCCITTWARLMVPFVCGAFPRWTGAISNSIGDAAREAGAEIRTEAPIEKIILKNARQKGWC